MERSSPTEPGGAWISRRRRATRRTSNLERFAPLETIADSLIRHLSETYEVVVEDDPALATELQHARDDVMRAMRITSGDGAPLTFVFTSFPSVIVHAGEFLDLLYPTCGCDACDESWDTVADELEWQVLAVAAGGLAESVREGEPPTIDMLLESPGVASIGGGMSTDMVPPERLERARGVLAGGRRWSAWTPRPPG